MCVDLFPEGSSEEHERDLRVLLARDDATVFVAERDDGSVCGFVEAGTRPYVDGCDSSPVGYIEAWYVDPDSRRAGVGRALLNAAEGWAIDRGYTEMGSDAPCMGSERPTKMTADDAGCHPERSGGSFAALRMTACVICGHAVGL
jgi:GNAT superfamily N-acetyltransferase